MRDGNGHGCIMCRDLGLDLRHMGERPVATRSWTASFIMLIAFNSPEKACEKRTPAIKLLTPPQTPEPITMSVEAAAHDRAK